MPLVHLPLEVSQENPEKSHAGEVTCDLGMPLNPPGGAEKHVWGQGHLGSLAQPAVNMTQQKKNEWMDVEIHFY